MALVLYIINLYFSAIKVSLSHTLLILRIINQLFSYAHGTQCTYQNAEDCSRNRYFQYIE